MALHAKYTIFGEGARGHLGRQLIARYKLDEGKDPQAYGIGIKELWQIDPAKHEPGLVVHAAGWRIEPPVSVPVAPGAILPATTAALPPDDPPGASGALPPSLRRHGLMTLPK